MTHISPTTINMSKGFGEVLIYLNTVTNNWISNFLLISIYLVILVGFYKVKDDFQGAFASAGYGTFVVALLLWIGGFVSGISLGICIAMGIIGTIVLLMDNN